MQRRIPCEWSEFALFEGHTPILYSVVAPVVPAGWTQREPVPAWAICEVTRESKGEEQTAQKECVALLAQPAIYEREGFDADLPNAPMVEKAMARPGLSQAKGAPVFVLHEADDALPAIIMPLLLLLFSIGALTGAVNKYLEASPSSDGH